MTKINEEEKDIEIPGEENENVGGEAPKKKKRRKSKEEKMAERRVIFWTMIVILMITLGFWLVPKVGGILKGGLPKAPTKENTNEKTTSPKTEPKNYVEITL